MLCLASRLEAAIGHVGDTVLHIVADHAGGKRCKDEKVVEADHVLLVLVKLGAVVPFRLEHLLRCN